MKNFTNIKIEIYNTQNVLRIFRSQSQLVADIITCSTVTMPILSYWQCVKSWIQLYFTSTYKYLVHQVQLGSPWCSSSSSLWTGLWCRLLKGISGNGVFIIFVIFRGWRVLCWRSSSFFLCFQFLSMLQQQQLWSECFCLKCLSRH